MTTPGPVEGTIKRGFYLALKEPYRPNVVEFAGDHWRNAVDERMPDPLAMGYELWPITHSIIPTAVSRRDRTIASLTAERDALRAERDDYRARFTAANQRLIQNERNAIIGGSETTLTVYRERAEAAEARISAALAIGMTDNQARVAAEKRADKLAAIVKANAQGAIAYAEMEGRLREALRVAGFVDAANAKLDAANQVIRSLEVQRDDTHARLAAAEKERDQWKANHDNQVRIKRALAVRRDLPMDAHPSRQEFIDTLLRVESQRDVLQRYLDNVAVPVLKRMREDMEAAEARERAMRAAWIRARRVVRAARAVCSAWPNSPECDPLDDAIDILHDMVTAYDQAGHTDDATGAGGES